MNWKPFRKGFLWFWCLTMSIITVQLAWSQDSIPDMNRGETNDSAEIPTPYYDLDYVETGIHRFSLASPYETVLTHLYYLQEKNWHPDSAAMTLNIASPSSNEAKEKAIKLKQFLDGAGYFIDLDALPRDPDYTDTVSGLYRFVLTKSEPEIFLYKKSRGWVYSWTTVKAIDRLHKRIYPFGTMKWLPEWSQRQFLGMHLWQFLGILIFILFTILLHKLLTRMFSFLLGSALGRFVKGERALDYLMKTARPVSLLVLFIALQMVFPALQFSIEFNKWVITAFRIMIPVFGMLVALQAVNLMVAYFGRHANETATSLDNQLLPLLRNLMKSVVVIVAFIIVLRKLNVDITAVIGGVAFGTLAFALAAQDTIKNLFGSVIIFLDRPFRIGDWVIIGDNEGEVEEVSVRSTRIRTFANSLISIPNGNIAAASINNMGARVYRRFVTRVHLHISTPPDLIEIFVDGVRELVRNHPGTRKDSFEVYFETIGSNSLEVMVYVFFSVPNWSKELEGRQALLLSILGLAETLGIGYPSFPRQVAHQVVAEEVAEGEAPTKFDPEAAKMAMRVYVSAQIQKLDFSKEE